MNQPTKFFSLWCLWIVGFLVAAETAGGGIPRLFLGSVSAASIPGLLAASGFAAAVVAVVFVARRFPPFRTHGLEDLALPLVPGVVGLLVGVGRVAAGGSDAVAILEPIGTGLGFPAAVLGLGALLGRVLRVPPADAESRAPFLEYLASRGLLGSVGLSSLLALAAFAGVFRPAVLLAGWCVVLAATLPFVLSDLLRIPPGVRVERARTIPHGVLRFSSLTVLCGVCFLAFLPPDDSDELRYHMTFPLRYLEHGGWVEIPGQAFSYFPMGMDILAALPLSLDWLRPESEQWGWVSGGKAVHAWYLILTVAVLWLWIREVSGDWIVGGWLFASIPFVPVLGSWAFVDLAAAFAWIASAYYAWRAIPLGGRGELLSAIGVGFGLTVKYPSYGWWVILGVVVFLFRAVRRAPVVRWGAGFVAIPLLVASPWWLNNLLCTGNPFSPLASSVFGGGYDAVEKGFYDWHAGMKGGLNVFWDSPWSLQALDLISLPSRLALFPEEFEFNPLGGLLALCVPMALGFLYGRRLGRSGELLYLGGLCGAVYLFWALTYRDPRFVLALWGFVAALLAAGWASMVHEAGGRKVGVILGILALVGLMQCGDLFARVVRFGPAVVRAESPADYLSRPDRIPLLRTAFEVERMRRTKGPRPTLLLLGQEQSYYFRSPVFGNDYFDGPWLAEVAREADSVEGISERIRAEGIEWIWINRETLETNAFNLIRGHVFSLPPEEGRGRMEAIRREAPMGLSPPGVESLLAEAEGSEVFRRMHAWLIRHPGFRRVELATLPEGERPISPFYGGWLEWPEMRGVGVEALPREPVTLLVDERTDPPRSD